MGDSKRASPSETDINALFWFRKGLRLHDNPALKECLKGASTIRCVYFLDPWFAGSQRSSNSDVHKWKFLLESLKDLDRSLKEIHLRLFVVRGQPTEALPKLFKKWNINRMAFEYDSEPFGQKRDEVIKRLAENSHVEVQTRVSHTLYDPAEIIRFNCGRIPYSHSKFLAILSSYRLPDQPLARISTSDTLNCKFPVGDREEEIYRLPTLSDLGFDSSLLKATNWKGGETEALRRMKSHVARKIYLCNSNSNKISGGSLCSNETVLEPYLRFGCISSRLLFHTLRDLTIKLQKEKSAVQNIFGQLLWREFIYTISMNNVDFDKAKGNPIVLQISWSQNSEQLQTFERGQTGYPLIDAIMAQLREEGWIHPISRIIIARFLTWGDLWISWEEGCKIFEDALLDTDWSLSAGFWMWTCSKPFVQQFSDSFCPIKTGKKIDPQGCYVRRYLPQLKSIPSKYVHAPWEAPLPIQRQSCCVVGVDYPAPMVNHEEVRRMNMRKLKPITGRNGEHVGTSKVPKPTPTIITTPPVTATESDETSNDSAIANTTYHPAINGVKKFRRHSTEPPRAEVELPSSTDAETSRAVACADVKAKAGHQTIGVQTECIPSTGFVVCHPSTTSAQTTMIPQIPGNPDVGGERCVPAVLAPSTHFLLFPPLPGAAKRPHRVISLPRKEEQVDEVIFNPEFLAYRPGNHLMEKGHTANIPEAGGPKKRIKMFDTDPLSYTQGTQVATRSDHGDAPSVRMHDITNTSMKETQHMPFNNFQSVSPATKPHYTSANLYPRVNLMPSLKQCHSEDRFHFLGPTTFYPVAYQHMDDDVQRPLIVPPVRPKQQLCDITNVPPLVTVLPPFNHMSFCTPLPGACAVITHAKSLLPKHKKIAVSLQDLHLPLNIESFRLQ